MNARNIIDLNHYATPMRLPLDTVFRLTYQRGTPDDIYTLNIDDNNTLEHVNNVSIYELFNKTKVPDKRLKDDKRWPLSFVTHYHNKKVVVAMSSRHEFTMQHVRQSVTDYAIRQTLRREKVMRYGYTEE